MKNPNAGQTGTDETTVTAGGPGRLRRAVLGVSIHFKIVGISLLVALLFGSITLFVTRLDLDRFVESGFRRQTIELGEIVADIARRQGSMDRAHVLRQVMDAVSSSARDVTSIGAYDGELRAVAGSPRLPEPIRARLQRERPPGSSGETFLVLAGRRSHEFDLLVPIGTGEGHGWLWLRASGSAARRTGHRIMVSFLLALGFSFFVAQLLAMWLSGIIRRSIQALTSASQRLACGDFTVRASVHSNDEIGQLAQSFNRMAVSLELFRDKVQRHEHERQKLLDRLVTAHEDEKRSLARELHDQFGQSLSLMLLVSHSLKKGADQAKQETIRTLEAQIQSMIRDIRRSAYSLRPSILDDYGLDSAVRRYVDLLQEHASFEITYNYRAKQDGARLPEKTETALYRVVQEALTNVTRHADASHVGVAIRWSQGSVELRVTDDGKGLDHYGERCLGQGLGLLVMEERASALGGAFEVLSRAGSGTEIRVTLPASWPTARRGS